MPNTNTSQRVNQQRAQLLQARRPSPHFRANRTLAGDGAPANAVRGERSPRGRLPNVGVQRQKLIEQDRNRLSGTPTEVNTVDLSDRDQQLITYILQADVDDATVPETPTPVSKFKNVSQGVPPDGEAKEQDAEATPAIPHDDVSAVDKADAESQTGMSKEGNKHPQECEKTEMQAEPEVDKVEALSDIGKDEYEPPISATQAVRQVELAKARKQYDQVKQLFLETKEGVELLEAEAGEWGYRQIPPTVAHVLERAGGRHEGGRAAPHGRSSLRAPRSRLVNKRKASASAPEGTSKKVKHAGVEAYLDLEAKSRGREKSRAFVTLSDDEWAAGNPTGSGATTQKQGDADKGQAADEGPLNGETMAEDKDLPLPLQDTTPDEVLEIKQTRDAIISSQFNWGDVLSLSVCNVIRAWSYDEESTVGKPRSEDLGPHLMYVKALIDDKDLMELRLRTAPRLMQVSAQDPFFRSDFLNWDEIVNSTLYPWSKKNAIFRALHVMTVRTDRKPNWTSHSIIKGHIKAGYAILHNTLGDALKIVAFKNDHSSIDIRVGGDDGVAEPMLEQSKTMAWLCRQCWANEDDSGSKQRGRVGNASVKSLQKKFFHVLLGVNLVFESEVHNGLLALAKERGTSVRNLRAMKALQKNGSVLVQLYNDRNKYNSGKVKSISGSKTAKTIAPTQSTSSQSANITEEDKKVSAQTSRDIMEFKKECLHYLALFLMYGTASFFHAWPTFKDVSMPESALFVNLASLLADRRYDLCGDEQHKFGDRAWNRLDELMFKTLKMFITDSGQFRKDIKWSEMTKVFYTDFDVKKMAGLFMLDLLSETHKPGLSLGLKGLVLDHVELKDGELKKMNGPENQSFRALWGPTEGPLQPVSDRGASLYPEVDSQGRIRSKETSTAQKDASDSEGEEGSGEESSGEEESGEEEGSEENED
ncbi:hypothetical protein DFH28DRAFT_1141503 [Melampsora americana]|nr:hypothetical protein DFH28DRAFT_1141503 [Melampsora americana]